MCRLFLQTQLFLMVLVSFSFSQFALAQGQSLTLEDVMGGAVQTKELERRGKSPQNFPTDSSGVIDVNKIPDAYSSHPQRSSAAPETCKMMVVDTSTTLYGIGSPEVKSRKQCVCGLEIADPRNCQ